MEVAAQQIAPGEQIGPYQVVRRLGAGGMGEVYLARHRHLNRDAAVKVLLAEISMNQTVVSRFFTEARATAQLRHPNIVEIFDCDILPDGRAYIVMEFLRGESLRNTLDRLGKLVPDYGSIAAITGMVADALQAAHENGIVHRDLKPDNTFLTELPNQREDLIVKVLDFGIAKLLSGGDRTGGGGTPTRTGALIGTPLYMSPEQCRGITTIDHRADIYSLGCMLFEMVVGQPPFVSEAPGDILMAHILQDAPPLSSFQPDVPSEIATLVAQMLAKDPAMRPQSMAEIVGAIETFLQLRKTELATVLKRPVGFPEISSQIPTQILPPDGTSSQRPTPPITKRGNTPGLAATTPLDPVITPSRQKSTPVVHAPTPSRQKSMPAVHTATPSRQKLADTVETPYATSSKNTFAADKPKWILPLAIIVGVVGLGGTAAYFLTKPQPSPPGTSESQSSKKTEHAVTNEQPPKKSAEFEPPSEVSVEINSTPEGAAVWVVGEDSSRGSTPTKLTMPRSSSPVDVILKAPGYFDKRLSLDASRDRTMSINLEAREAAHPVEHVNVKPPAGEKTTEKTSGKKKKPGGNKPGETPGSGGGFKPVGD